MAAVSHLPVAASSGSFLITPNVGLMIWTLLLFGISMYILWKLAFPRISEALDRRQHAIEESIDHAERFATTPTSCSPSTASGFRRPGARPSKSSTGRARPARRPSAMPRRTPSSGDSS